jgi:hypothetical protein
LPHTWDFGPTDLAGRANKPLMIVAIARRLFGPMSSLVSLVSCASGERGKKRRGYRTISAATDVHWRNAVLATELAVICTKSEAALRLRKQSFVLDGEAVVLGL